MLISECLGLTGKTGTTAIVGGGGKTSLMYRLAEEISGKGKSVVVTTTTKIMNPSPNLCVYSDAAKIPERLAPGAVVCLGVPISGGKLSYPGENALHFAATCVGRVIAEADGAKGLPMKAPAEHEPVIPDWCDTVIAVSGLDAMGRPLKEVCFRYEIACDILKVAPDTLVTPGDSVTPDTLVTPGDSVTPDTLVTPKLLAHLIMSEKGQKKGIPENAFFSVVLNKADDKDRILLGIETAKEIQKIVPYTRVIITSLKDKDAVKAIHG